MLSATPTTHTRDRNMTQRLATYYTPEGHMFECRIVCGCLESRCLIWIFASKSYAWVWGDELSVD